MKKKSKILFFSLILTLLFCLLPLVQSNFALSLNSKANFIEFTNNENKKILVDEVVKETPTESTTENELPMPELENSSIIYNDESGIVDTILYQKLITVYNITYEGRPGFERQTVLKYDTLSEIKEIRINGQGIENLTGLDRLNLKNLEILDLGKNRINIVEEKTLRPLRNLKELKLYNNNIEKFEIPRSLINLRKLNLNANKISYIDLSNLRECEIYLSLNKFTSIKDVVLPQKKPIINLYVELFNNNILDADELFLQGFVEDGRGKIKFELGLQGYGLTVKKSLENEEPLNVKISRDNKLKFYNVEKLPLKVLIKEYSFDFEESGEIVQTIENNSQFKISDVILPVGVYIVEYVNANTNEKLYNYTTEDMIAFQDSDAFSIIPKAPTVKFLINGKEYDNYKKFSSWKAKLVARNNEEEGKLFYSIHGGKWIEGNEVKLNRGGRYNVSFKCVYNDGTESPIVSKLVYMSMNPYIPDSVMLLLVAFGIIVFLLIVIPLIKKYGLNR